MQLNATIGPWSFSRMRTWADGSVDWRRDQDGMVFAHMSAADAAGAGLDAAQVAAEYPAMVAYGTYYDQAGNAYPPSAVYYGLQGIMYAESGVMVMSPADYDRMRSQISADLARQAAGLPVATVGAGSTLPDLPPAIVKTTAPTLPYKVPSQNIFDQIDALQTPTYYEQTMPNPTNKPSAGTWAIALGILFQVMQ